MKKRAIRFIFRGQPQEVQHSPTTRTILQYLREDVRCTGTKEGCAEGDCGACTVMLGELDANGQLALRAVNSCIQLLPTLDGKALYTVEDLAAQDGTLHPVQQAMMDTHGAQCGFCTPGFLMSLWGLYLRHQAQASIPTRAEIDDVLSGNLCRCTGYRPIIDAALRMHEYPAPDFDQATLSQQLEALQEAGPLAYEYAGQTFHAPQTLAQLAQLRLEYPDARLLAGSTDIGLWVTRQFRALPHLIYTGRVKELHQIQRQGSELYIGAAASLNHAYDALLEYFPELRELRQRFASYPIRNAGTLGGNVANGSPIGDSMPWLIATRASIVLQQGERVRHMPLEDYYLAYQKTALEAGEFVQGLRIPLDLEHWHFRTYKLSKRHDQDISAVCAAYAIKLDAQGHIEEVRVAYGGMAATPKRALQCEAVLKGQNWDSNTVQQGMQALAQDFQPLSDMRASAPYRLLSAQNLLHRFYLETRLESPLAAHQLSVFSHANEGVATSSEEQA